MVWLRFHDVFPASVMSYAAWRMIGKPRGWQTRCSHSNSVCCRDCSPPTRCRCRRCRCRTCSERCNPGPITKHPLSRPPVRARQCRNSARGHLAHKSRRCHHCRPVRRRSVTIWLPALSLKVLPDFKITLPPELPDDESSPFAVIWEFAPRVSWSEAMSSMTPF